MRLILGQFTQREAIALQATLEDARRRAQTHGGAVLVPYYGDRPVQVVDLMPRRMPRKRISIQAHTVG